MAKQPDDVQLLALALLNYADDEGYFYADPALVRSALRPFDESSTKVRRGLEQLVKCGWIEVCEDPSQHGPIGRVVKFPKHQKIDRPNLSTIKDYWRSTNDQRVFDESSLLEGKGKEGRVGDVGSQDATLAKGSNGQRSPEDSIPRWLEDLRAEYTWVNFDQEVVKARAHLRLPKNKGRQFTQRYFTGWLNRIDKPVTFPQEKPKDIL